MDLEIVDSIDSTNAELLRRPFAAAPRASCALLALEQTAGRGRLGRPWHAARGASLTLSVAVERSGAPLTPGLTLALGVAAAIVVESFGTPRIGLKWPNDLQIGGAKLAGLLVQARSVDTVERVVIGIGVNLRSLAGIERGIAQPVTALDRHLAAVPGPQQLAERLAPALAEALVRHAAEGFAACELQWRQRDALAGHSIVILEADGSRCEAVALGVDAQGFLLARTGDQTRRVVSADVSVRTLG